MLRIAVPNKGSLSETAAQMLHEAGYAGRRDPQGAASSPTRATTSSSSTCARATSPPTSAPARSTSASPAATCCSTRGSTAAEIDGARLRRLHVPLRRPDRALHRARRPRGRARRHQLPRPRRRLPRRARRRRRRSSRLDGAVESAVRLGVADAVADVVETGSTLAQAGPRDLRPGHPRIARPCSSRRRRRRRRASTRCGAACRACMVARQYVLMDYDLPAALLDAGRRDHARASSRRRSRRCATPTGSPCG